MNQTPFYPKPTNNKASLLITFFMKNKSWLDSLYVKSYTMKMGRVKMPGLDLHIVNQPELIQKVMVDDVQNFPKSKLLGGLLAPLLGQSIFTTNGEQWKKQRDMLDPSFANARISKVYSLMCDSVDDLLISLDQKYQKSPTIEVDEEMTYTTADIIFRTIMSKKLNKKDANKILLAFVTFQEETAKTAMRQIFNIPQWISYFLGERKRIKAGHVIREVLTQIIQPRYDAITNNEPINETDILSTLLQVINPSTNKRFSFEEILNQVAMLFLAGHETTASSLTWALYLLSISQEEQEKAYQEILQISGNKEFTNIDLKRMKHLNNIFKETLRLYPPVGFFSRESAKDIVIRKKKIKKGSSIIVSPWLIQRNEKYWDNPHDFKPDRFLEPEKITKNTYFPFGMGQRVCIGSSFAMQESILILASILRTYKLELESGFVPNVVGRLTIRSANGMNIVFTKRN